MAALKTLFRTVVMLAVVVILVKAWFHFGLTVDKVQEFGARVVQIAQDAWNEYQDSRQANPALVGDPQLHSGPAPFDPPTIEPPPIHPPPLSAPLSGPVQFADGSSLAAPDLSSRAPTSIDTAPAAALVPMDAPAAISASGDVAQMLDQLTHAGVVDLDLKPWGGSGRLFRFTCSAPWINSPSFTRHFEAVAETPEGAVAQVTAEIEAWQRGQQR